MPTDPDPQVITAKTDVSGPVLDFIESLHGPTGKILKAAYKLGGVRLIYALVIQPLLFVLLAAFWMLLLNGIEWAPIRGVRESFVTLVHTGFSVDKAAEATSARDAKVIDFVQVTEFNLTPGEPTKSIPVRLNASQKARVDVHLNKSASACFQANPKAVELLVYLKDERANIMTFPTDYDPRDRAGELDSKWWEANVRYLDVEPDTTDRRVWGDVVLKRSDANASSAMECEFVRGHVHISAFKTYFPSASTATSQSKKVAP